MKKLTILLFIISIFTLSYSQDKAVHYSKLKECLPTIKLEGFEMSKPEGSTQTISGFSSSVASVNYTKTIPDTAGENAGGSDYVSIEIMINDLLKNPAAAAIETMMSIEMENDEEITTSITLDNKYKGIMTISKTEDKSSKLQYVVKSRFVIAIDANGTNDQELIMKLAKAIDTKKLEALAEGK